MTKPSAVKRSGRGRLRRLWLTGAGCGATMVGLSFIGGFDGSQLWLWGGAGWVVLGTLGLLDVRFNHSDEKIRAAVPLPALGEGEVLLWSDAAVDRQDRLSRSGGLLLTNRRLGFRPRQDQYDKPVEREWSIESLESVWIEPVDPADGEASPRTLVFDFGADGLRRFVVFDAESAQAEITAKVDELKGARS